MKHIKTYENKDKPFWVVMYIDFTTNEIQVDIFENQESAENYFLYLSNEEKKSYLRRKNLIFGSKDLLVNMIEAKEWLIDNAFDYNIYFKEEKSISQFKLPQEIEIEREARKYNL
jgi:hypothetical protein